MTKPMDWEAALEVLERLVERLEDKERVDES